MSKRSCFTVGVNQLMRVIKLLCLQTEPKWVFILFLPSNICTYESYRRRFIWRFSTISSLYSIMRVFELIIVVLLGQLVESATFSYEALNQSCLNATNIEKKANDSTIYLRVVAFNYVHLEVDLRHLLNSTYLENVDLYLTIDNQESNTQYNELLFITNAVNTYSLYLSVAALLSASFRITQNSSESALSRSYLLGQSVSLKVIPASETGEQHSFLFVVRNQDQISLPYNMIQSQQMESFSGYFLSSITSIQSMKSRQQTIPSYSDYWNGFDTVALPYLPYFSNCEDNGDYLYFQQMIHNKSECNLYGDSPIPINEFQFGSHATADTCTISRKCMYDEIPNTVNEYPFWNTLDSGTMLFYVTSSELPSHYISEPIFSDSDLVPCSIKNTSGTNSSLQYPLKVSLSFGYYQSTTDTRKMLTCEVDYSLYVTSTTNFNYQLEISYQPLNHTQILLNFGFDWYIYMLVFMIIGLVSNLQFVIFWAFHKITAVRSRSFNFKIYFRLIREIGKGSAFAFIVTISLTFLVEVIMNGTFFGNKLFSSFHSVWDSLVVKNIGYFAENNLDGIRSGRMGFSYLIIASYLMVVLSEHLIGQEMPEAYKEYQVLGRQLKPKQWKQGKFLFGSLLMILLCLIYLYFTYSSIFSNNIWVIIAIVQVLQMVIEELLFSIYDDQLPCLPLKLTLGVMAYLATMGAIDLYYFILGYLVDVAISTIQIPYLSQLQQRITQFFQQKSEQFNKFYLNMLNDDDEDYEKAAGPDPAPSSEMIQLLSRPDEVQFIVAAVEEEYNEVEPQSVPEYIGEADLKAAFVIAMSRQGTAKEEAQAVGKGEIEQAELINKKFQLVLDCTTNMLQYMLQPIIVLMLWITYSTSGILNSFNISLSTCILYLLSSIILAVFFQINVVIIFHILEIYLNIDYKPLLKHLLDRFVSKSIFWITDQPHSNSSLDIKLRGAHRYCVSSQMFFVISLYVCAMYLFILGVTTLATAQFNVFRDPFLPVILSFWFIFLFGLFWLVKKITHFFDIWGYASLSEVSDEKKQNQLPSADEQTQQILLHQSMTGSSIRFTFKQLSSDAGRRGDSESKIEIEKKQVAQAKLKTVCNKLQPQFLKEGFRLEYSRKNKQFIRQNVEKILPLITKFPQNDGFLLSKSNMEKQSYLKKQTKNCQPYVSDFLASWLKRTQTNRSKRVMDGVQRERKLKKCNFCFSTWNLYYGFDGICLNCSKKLFAGRSQLKQD